MFPHPAIGSILAIDVVAEAVFLAKFIPLVWILFVAPLHAQQQLFDREITDEQIHYQYEWLDRNQQLQTLSFALPASTLQTMQSKQKSYRPAVAQRYVIVELFKLAQQVDPREARISLQQRGGQIEIMVNSRTPQLLDKWQTEMEKQQRLAFLQYLYDHHYTEFTTHLGEQGIKPDHVRYATENRNILIPAAQAIYDKVEEQSDVREYVDLLLSWIQTIPYNTLEDRLVSNGAGFAPPLDLLYNNLGDCDSKTTLTASLIRALLPDVPMAIIYLPEHALLAISLPYTDNDETRDIDGTRYLLFEPTGPAQFNFAEISSSSAADMNGNRFSFEIVP